MDHELELRAVTPTTRPVVEHLWQLYRHDLSEFRGMLPEEDGTFHARSLPAFVENDPGRIEYLLYRGANPVGFAFVSNLRSEARLMHEFFVVRGVRGQGVARAAVGELFALHPGTWEIPFQENNVVAARFWRRIAAEVAGEGVREELRPVLGKPQIPHDVWITIAV